MKFFTNNYHNPQLWMATIVLREAKKGEAQTVVTETPVVNQQVVSTKAEVIFRQEDIGHNAEETGKIQKLYEDIRRVGWAPSFAG